LGRAPGKLSVSPMPREDSAPFRNVAPPISAPSGILDEIDHLILLLSSFRPTLLLLGESDFIIFYNSYFSC